MALKTNLKQLELPYLEVLLPSKGAPYRTPEHPFPDKVRVKPFSWATEAVLLGNALPIEKHEAILSLVVEADGEKVDGSMWVDGDYQFIMAVARSLTYGDDYRFVAVCPACERQEKAVFKVPDQLPVRQLDVSGSMPTTEDVGKYLEIVLPFTKDRVQWRFLSLGEERKIMVDTMSRIKDLTKNAPASEAASQRERAEAAFVADVRKLKYASRIVSVNGGKPDSIQESVDYVTSLPGQDFYELQEAIEGKSFGIITTYPVICDGCGYAWDAHFPLESEFFRRSSV